MNIYILCLLGFVINAGAPSGHFPPIVTLSFAQGECPGGEKFLDEVRKVCPRIEELLKKAKKLEEKGKIGQAESIYQKIIRDYSNASYEDNIESGFYADIARGRLIITGCLKKKGIDYSEDCPLKLSEKIFSAIKKKEKNALLRLASCDFTIGYLETDNVWSIPPEKVISIMMEEADQINWKFDKIDASLTGEYWDLVLFDVNRKWEYLFSIIKQKGKWKWVGFSTTKKEILDRLRTERKGEGD